MATRLRRVVAGGAILLGAATFALPQPVAALAPRGADLAFWPLPQERDKAAALLGAERCRDPAPAQALARDPDPAVRARAMLALGRVGLPASLPWLLEAGRDPEPLVRAAAAFALGLLQYDLDFLAAGASRQRADEALKRLLSDADAGVAARAAAALGAVGIGGGHLRIWLSDASRHPAEVVAEAVGSWWRLEPGDVAPLAPFVAATDAYVRLQVAHALRRSRDPDRAPLLAHLLGDADVEVRVMALRGLSFAPARLAYAHVAPFLQQGEWREQCEALAWLGAAWRAEQGKDIDEDIYVQVVRRSLDRNIHTRACALRALGALPERAVSVDLLLESLSDPEAAVQAAAIETLAAMTPSTLRAAIRRLDGLVVPVPPLLAAPAMRLRARAGDLDAPALARLTADADPRLAGAALDELERSDPGAAWPAARAMLAAADADRAVAGAAAVGRLFPYQPDEAERAAAGDELWRAFADRRELALRTAAFESMERLAGDMLVRRRVLLQEVEDPALRRRIARFLATRSVADGRDMQTAARMLLPACAAPDAMALAVRALQLQAQPPLLRLDTARGSAVVRLRADRAPLTVMRILDLVDAGVLEGAPFYRVIPAFVAQGGPASLPPWSTEGVPSEETPARISDGILGLALAGRDTGTTQFWIATAAQPHLQGGFPIFAEVIEGMRAVARIQPGDTMRWSRVQEQP